MTTARGVLYARVADASMLTAMLRAVNFTAFATISISASGLEVVSEVNKAVQAHAYLYASIFDEYSFVPPRNWMELANRDDSDDEDAQPYISFELNVSTMVQCLTLFEGRMHANDSRGMDARRRGDYVEITYRDFGEPLSVGLHTGRIDMNFRLRTLDSSMVPDLQFSPETTVAQVIMKSEYLARAFQELDAGGETQVHVHFRPRTGRTERGGLDLSTENSHGSTEISFPNENQLTEKFDCVESVACAYPLQCVAYMLQAIKTSLKTSLRIDENGMLSVQFMIASHHAQAMTRSAAPLTVAASGHAFVEFLCCPLTDA
ncbi:hypothetical protein GLX27_000472 [Malassezia furfur]|uniref:Checkpoint protein n=1 Tax=Malassezia furfur TaxID=55194 RepID=A0ABY8EJF7_MALFU|nr:hypothetical protein GLX27_000472 [Malassezia furfur]